jgi:TIR domain
MATVAARRPGRRQRQKARMLEREQLYMPVKLFIAYSHVDELMKQELVKHLSSLSRSGIVQEWHDRRIEPGADWNWDIDRHLNHSDIILLLISADFIHSEYCYGVEMKRALERHECSEARVIPVILRPCDWHALPFGTIQAIPKDGKAVTTWSNQDEAYTDIARGVRAVIGDDPKEFSPGTRAVPPPTTASALPERPAPPPAAPTVAQFTATSIRRGQTSTLSWEVNGSATSVSINQGVGAVQSTGSKGVSPSDSTIYTLTATGPGGSATASATVIVSAGSDVVRLLSGSDSDKMEPPQAGLLKQRTDSASLEKECAENRERGSAILSSSQRLHIESAIYNRAKPRDEWVSTVLTDFREPVTQQENAAVIVVLKSLAASKLLLLGKWDRLGAHQVYPCSMSDDEMFCRGSFEIMVTKKTAPKFKRRLRSGD